MPNPTGTPNSAHPAGGAAAGHWVLDPAHSSVQFRSKGVWGLITVRGAFTAISGSGDVQPDGAAQGTLTIRTESLDTKHAKRDTHLRSADFFHSEEHPELVFSAKSVTPGADDTIEVTGELTLRGTARPLAFTAKVTDATADAVTLEAEFPVDREEHGFTWNQLHMIKGPTFITVKARYERRG
jgi:polyisoprenoid-binding protein YceI